MNLGTKDAIVIQRRPKPIEDDVAARYAMLSRGKLFSVPTIKPPNINPIQNRILISNLVTCNEGALCRHHSESLNPIFKLMLPIINFNYTLCS